MNATDNRNILTIGDRTYHRVNGTDYHVDTPQAVIDVLEAHRTVRKVALRLNFGHTEPGHEKLGRDWLEEFDTFGTIGRSMGNVSYAHGGVHAPLLVPKGKHGGPHILDQCIVRIRDYFGTELYRHPQYHHGVIVIRTLAEPMDNGKRRKPLTHEALVDGETHARFRSLNEATDWATKLGVNYTVENG